MFLEVEVLLDSVSVTIFFKNLKIVVVQWNLCISGISRCAKFESTLSPFGRSLFLCPPCVRQLNR